MSRRHRRIRTTTNDPTFITTIHQGFNTFSEIELPKSGPRLLSHQKRRAPSFAGMYSQGNLDGRQKNVADMLQSNKLAYSRIKTQFSMLRQVELNDYIKKSLKYQEILNINDNKKKRLPTLNSKIGEIVKKAVVQTTNKNVEYYISTTRYKQQGWRPESREGHTTTIYKNTAIVVGGHCSNPFSLAQQYCFDTQNWIKHMNLSSARSYHTAIFYKGRFIIIFGGMGTYDISRKCRVCYNSINLIDLQTWSCRALKMTNEEIIEGRRSHSAILMGKYMIVFGGMNTKREYLKDFVYLDLKELRWYNKEYKIEGRDLSENMMTGIARHKMLSNFRTSHKNFPLYSSQYADDEGIYVFGGTFGNGEDNIVSFISFNKYNPHYQKIEFQGNPPSSIEPLVERINDNIVAIIAGESSQRRLKLFLLREREYVSVHHAKNATFFGGIGSTLNRYNDELYLFFGLTSEGYIPSVNSFNIEQKVTESESKKRKAKRDYLMQWHLQKDVDSDSEFDN